MRERRGLALDARVVDEFDDDMHRECLRRHTDQLRAASGGPWAATNRIADVRGTVLIIKEDAVRRCGSI